MNVDRAPLPLYILISGRGSNMLAIAQACREQRIAARVVCVAADREGTAGIPAAQAQGLDTAVFPYRQYAGHSDFEQALAQDIDRHGQPLIILAGFMRILSPEFSHRFAGRMLNIHPSLLPAYPGLHTHRRALAAGEHWHGATVHYVTAELDGGPLVRQDRVPVLSGDTEDTLSARVHEQEYIIYPEVIAWIAGGRLQWQHGGPMLDGELLRAPVVSGAGVDA